MTILRKLIAKAALLGIICALSGAAIFAQEQERPLPPLDLIGEVVVLEKAPPQYDINLRWIANPEGARPDYFAIFSARQEISEPQIVGEVKYNEREEEYFWKMSDVEEGEYVFFVAAVKSITDENGEIIEVFSEESNPFFAKVEKDNRESWVHILNQFPERLEVGEEFVYVPEFVSKVDCPLEIEAETNCPGEFEVDYDNMSIRIKPEREGEYMLHLRAQTTDCDDELYREWNFHFVVGDGIGEEPCAEIFGSVYFADGSLPEFGVATAWMFLENDMDFAIPVAKNEFRGGEFALQVPQGVYAVSVYGKGFDNIFYVDARNIRDAERIEIACGDVREIEIPVSGGGESEIYKISGRVYSAESNAPVMASVEMIPVESVYGGRIPPMNERFVTRTNEDGFYQIEVPSEYYYIGNAMPDPNTGYFQQFYRQANNPFEANIIVLDGDVENIDFPLEGKAVENKNSFSGMVVGEGGEPLGAKIIAYRLDDDDSDEKYVRSEITNEEGYFTFQGLKPGVYTLLSIPANREYIPGYYHKNSLVVQSWRDASRIEVGDAIIQMIFECKHARKSGIEGNIDVNGQVVGVGGAIQKKDNPMFCGDYLAGALTYIENQKGDIVEYGFTDQVGVFTISGVGANEYKLHVDKVGYQGMSMTIDASEDKDDLDLSLPLITLLADNPNSVDDPAYTSANVKVRPSPVSETARVEYQSKGGKTLVSLFNSMGGLVFSEEFDAAFGDNSFDLDAANLPSGAYYLQIVSGGVQTSIPISVVK